MIGNKKKIINFLLDKDDNKEFEIKEYSKKRTLNQNSYYYELLGKLSKKMRISSEDLHFEMIKKSCPFEDYMVPDEANLRGIKYFETLNKRQINGKLFKIIRVYVGSSSLDTIEMGILLDSLIEECHLQNIETMTPDEIAKLKGLYDEKKSVVCRI